MQLGGQRNPTTHGGSEKLFGRYHELVLLLIGFVLTTIVGGLLTYWHQSLAWQREDLSRRKQEEMTRASGVFDDISRILDKRLYRLRNVQDALEEQLKLGDVETRRAEYRAAVAEWNESLNRNLWLTERYFGGEIRRELQGPVANGLRNLHRELAETLKAPTAAKVEQLKEDIDAFNPTIYALNGEMLDALRRGEVGEFISN